MGFRGAQLELDAGEDNAQPEESQRQGLAWKASGGGGTNGETNSRGHSKSERRGRGDERERGSI